MTTEVYVVVHRATRKLLRLVRGPLTLDSWEERECEVFAAAPPRDVVPGAMACARCKFRLQRMVMDASTGAIGVQDGREPERCPNGCGPLWPVTWEQEAHELGRRLEHFFDRAVNAERALAELVALKDIKDACLRRRQRRPLSVTRDYPADLLEAEADYNRRKPIAWEAARRVAAGASPAAPAGAPFVALVQFIDGLLASLGREPTEAELRAAAHALTVRADRIACARRSGDDDA